MAQDSMLNQQKMMLKVKIPACYQQLSRWSICCKTSWYVFSLYILSLWDTSCTSCMYYKAVVIGTCMTWYANRGSLQYRKCTFCQCTCLWSVLLVNGTCCAAAKRGEYVGQRYHGCICWTTCATEVYIVSIVSLVQFTSFQSRML